MAHVLAALQLVLESALLVALVLVALKKSQMEQTLALGNSDVTLSTDIRFPMPPSSASPSPCPGAGDVPDKEEAGSRSEC